MIKLMARDWGKIKRYAMFNIGMLLSCLPVIAVGTLIIGYGMRRFAALKRLEAVGVTVVGNVLEMQTARNADGTSATVTAVRFRTQTGALKQAVVRTFASVRVGELVPVIYDPAAPEQAEVLPLRPGVFCASIVGLGASFLCTAVFMLGLFAGFIPMIPHA
jgi:hypothetical protein